VANLRKVLWWIYGIQAAFIFAILLGGIARYEIPFWPSWNEAGDVYVHLIFYSVFLVLPYVILSAVYSKYTADMQGLFFILSVWVLTTICLFHEPIFDFVDAFFLVFHPGAPAWYQWLHILWVAFTVFMIIGWRLLSKDKAERLVQERLATHEQWLRRRWQAGTERQ
jgi:hypothetical protein